jgi:hypothetical protein
MFPCATDEIISHTDVQRPVSSACQNVNPETHGLGLLGPRFRGDERMLVVLAYPLIPRTQIPSEPPASPRSVSANNASSGSILLIMPCSKV